jgi:Sec-independent protein translocase protein TatA
MLFHSIGFSEILIIAALIVILVIAARIINRRASGKNKGRGGKDGN